MIAPMLDLEEGVLAEFAAFDYVDRGRRYILEAEGLATDNRLAQKKAERAKIHLIDNHLRLLRPRYPAWGPIMNVRGDYQCGKCRKFRHPEAYVVRSGRREGKTVATCFCCRKVP